MGKDVSDLAHAVSRQFGDMASVIPTSDMTFLSIVSARTSKSGALKNLLQSCALPLKDVLAFGDDVPDLDLLEACGMPVAMANCVPEVRAATSYITASNDDDGVAIVLEKMLGRIQTGDKQTGCLSVRCLCQGNGTKHSRLLPEVW